MSNNIDQGMSENTKTTPWAYVWIAAVFVVIGMLFVAWNYYVIASSTTALGTVLSVEKTVSKRSGEATSTVYSPLFSFVDENGFSRSQRTRGASSEYDFDLGQKIKIAYSPDNPAYVKVVDWSHAMFLPKLSFSMAGLMILLFAVTKKQAGDSAAEV